MPTRCRHPQTAHPCLSAKARIRGYPSRRRENDTAMLFRPFDTLAINCATIGYRQFGWLSPRRRTTGMAASFQGPEPASPISGQRQFPAHLIRTWVTGAVASLDLGFKQPSKIRTEAVTQTTAKPALSPNHARRFGAENKVRQRRWAEESREAPRVSNRRLLTTANASMS
jgi:hypothetical protein